MRFKTLAAFLIVAFSIWSKNLVQWSWAGSSLVPYQSFCGLQEAEEYVFNDLIGHIDGYQFINCPNLRRIVFNGPVLSTGGKVFAENCPQLEEVEINGIALTYDLTDFINCPKFKRIKVNGAVLNSNDTTLTTANAIKKIQSSPSLLKQVREIVAQQEKLVQDDGLTQRIGLLSAAHGAKMLRGLGLHNEAARLDSLIAVNPQRTYIEILQRSPAYVADAKAAKLKVVYTPPTDSMLTRTREYFNLDSIAGNGNDILRIKNLLHWVHDLVRHDGEAPWPECRFNLIDMADYARSHKQGYNCRMMAIMLTEALLAEGIPARYITCEPKDPYDTECHVINIAWSESLGKWIWVDPTFEAMITDDNGVYLHPGEVRERLRQGLTIVLNPDANWNHSEPQTLKTYIEDYMAKNLYTFSCNLLQQSEPEGSTDHPKGKVVALTAPGTPYTNAHYIINDDDAFWAPPIETKP